MLAFIMPSRIKPLLGILLGLAFAGCLLVTAGFFQPGAQVLGVPLGKPTQPIPSGDWSEVIRAEAAERGIVDWTLDSFEADLGYKATTRESFYRGVVRGARNGEAVTVRVELRAMEGQQWRVVQWNET